MTSNNHPHEPGQGQAHYCEFHDAQGVAGWRIRRATQEIDGEVDHVNLARELAYMRRHGWLVGSLDATRDRRINRTGMLGDILTPTHDELARAREQDDHTLLEQAQAAARLTDRLPQPLHRAAEVAHQQFHVQEQTEHTLTRRLWELDRAAARIKQPPSVSGGLSDRQQRILAVIRESVASRGYPPSVREIGERVGLKSTNAVHGHLAQLEQKGFIHRDASKPRAIVAKADRQPQPSREAQQLTRQRAETRAQIDAVRGIQRDLRAAGAAIAQRTQQLGDLDQAHHRTLSRGQAALKVLGERGHPTDYEHNGVRVDGVLDTKIGRVRLGPWDTVIAQPSRDEEAPHTLGGTGTVQALAAENARDRNGRPDVARREQAVRDRAQLAELARQLDPDPAPAHAPGAARQRPGRTRQQPAADSASRQQRLGRRAGPRDGRPGDRERGGAGRGRRSRDDDDGRER